jgi:hypothetical protein
MRMHQVLDQENASARTRVERVRGLHAGYKHADSFRRLYFAASKFGSSSKAGQWIRQPVGAAWAA